MIGPVPVRNDDAKSGRHIHSRPAAAVACGSVHFLRKISQMIDRHLG